MKVGGLSAHIAVATTTAAAPTRRHPRYCHSEWDGRLGAPPCIMSSSCGGVGARASRHPEDPRQQGGGGTPPQRLTAELRQPGADHGVGDVEHDGLVEPEREEVEA